MERWSMMGEVLANLQIQNNPLPGVGKMLRADWLHVYSLGELPEAGLLQSAVVAVDPAFSTEEPGDW